MKHGDSSVTLPGRPFSIQEAGWSGLAIFLATFALFSPSLQYEFVHIDDITYIANNTALHQGLTLSGIRHAFDPNQTTATMYMPLLWISYMLDIQWLGASIDHPWGFHFTNVLLHALNAAILSLLLYASGRRLWPALLMAAIWAWHPLRVESIAWVSERKDVLSGFFALLSIGAYLWAGVHRAATVQGRRVFLLTFASLIFFALGLLAKPAVAPLPLILLLSDVWPLKRLEFNRLSLQRNLPRLLYEKIPFLILAGLAAFGTVATHHVVSGEIHVPWLQRIQAIPLAYGFYLLNTLAPHNLTVLYPHWSNWLTGAQAALYSLLAGMALLGLTYVAWRNRQRNPSLLIGWLWFLIMLLPVSGIIPIPTNDVADRFTYLPAVGLSLALLGVWPFSVSKQRRRQAIGAGGSGLVLVALCLLTLRQLPAWHNAETLNDRVLTVFPNHATALETRAGNLMRATGDFEGAHRLLERALQNDPHHWKALLAQAQCLWALEDAAAARDQLLSIHPPTSQNTRSQWHRDLARYTLMLGDTETAIAHAESALALLPQNDLARIPLLLLAMTAAFEADNIPRALAYARQFPPYAQKTLLELADLLPHAVFQWTAGYRQDAVDYFLQLAQAHPDRLDYLNNLVWGLATAEWSPVDAHEVLDMAARLASMAPAPHPGILDTKAAAQANAGDFESAVQTMQEALALFPPSTDPELLLFKERLAYRLALYEQKRPYREDAFIRLFVATVGDLARISEPTTE